MRRVGRGNTGSPHLVLVTANPIRVGGMQRFTRFLLRAACEADWRVTLALSGQNIYEDIIELATVRPVVESVEWVDADFGGDRRYRRHVIRDRYRWFRHYRPDVALFVQSSNTPFRASMVAARLAGVRVVSTHRTMPWIRDFVPRGRHCFGLISGLGLHNRRQILATRIAALAAHRIVYNAQAVREAYERDYHYPIGKGIVIPNAVSVSPTTVTCRAGDAPVTVGYVGRLGDEKRIDVLLHAMAELRTGRPIRVLIYGDGPERTNLQRIAANLGLSDRVRFAGETDDPSSAYAEMDIVVLCSRREASSNMVLEAMAAGRAVVVTDVGGQPELIGFGRWGRCVPVGDPAALASTLEDLIDNEAERSRLGDLARQVARARHDPDRVGQAWLDLLAEPAGRTCERSHTGCPVASPVQAATPVP